MMGHVKYMLGETEVAKDCYERTLAFVSDASEMHSIYLRLASIYLQEAKVGERLKTIHVHLHKASRKCFKQNNKLSIWCLKSLINIL